MSRCGFGRPLGPPRARTGLEGIEWAITLTQPWAGVVIAGPKDIENRVWSVPQWLLRGTDGKRTIAIHASKTSDQDAWEWILERHPEARDDRKLVELANVLGAFVGTARIAGVWDPVGPGKKCPCNNPWHMHDQYGWALEDRRLLPKPIPARGFQRLWRVPKELR